MFLELHCLEEMCCYRILPVCVQCLSITATHSSTWEITECCFLVASISFIPEVLCWSQEGFSKCQVWPWLCGREKEKIAQAQEQQFVCLWAGSLCGLTCRQSCLGAEGLRHISIRCTPKHGMDHLPATFSSLVVIQILKQALPSIYLTQCLLVEVFICK